MSRRREVQLTPAEQAAFLRDVHKAALATVDKDGFPHVVAMSFFDREGVVYMTSYAKAQKVVNIRRNPRVAVMIEAGNEYAAFRGVMIRGHCEIVDDPKLVESTMREVAAKQGRTAAPGGAIASAAKRVVLKVTPEKIATWDHTKLAGRY